MCQNQALRLHTASAWPHMLRSGPVPVPSTGIGTCVWGVGSKDPMSSPTALGKGGSRSYTAPTHWDQALEPLPLLHARIRPQKPAVTQSGRMPPQCTMVRPWCPQAGTGPCATLYLIQSAGPHYLSPKATTDLAAGKQCQIFGPMRNPMDQMTQYQGLTLAHELGVEHSCAIKFLGLNQR